jgi:hypothetical protein
MHDDIAGIVSGIDVKRQTIRPDLSSFGEIVAPFHPIFGRVGLQTERWLHAGSRPFPYPPEVRTGFL